MQRIVDKVLADKKIFVLTGAGISVPSGIPDFRSDEGLWTRYPVEEYATLDAFRKDPTKIWDLFFHLHESVTSVVPNPAHEALVRIERCGVDVVISTQNIDHLHQRAGSTRVLELHGNSQKAVCISCFDFSLPIQDIFPARRMPVCSKCNAIMKPDMILFDEPLPDAPYFISESCAEQYTVCLVIGTSLNVYPAAELPYIAVNSGAFLAEFNLNNECEYADIYVEGSVDQTLPNLASLIEQQLLR